MNILGIHDGHNASAVLLVDGKVTAGAQEERFRNVKNYFGFPTRAVEWVLRSSGLQAEDIDKVAVGTVHLPRTFDIGSIRDVFRYEQEHFIRSRLMGLARYTPLFSLYKNQLKNQRLKLFKKAGFAEQKINFIDHHTCHAAAAYYGSPWRDDVLVLTLDGGGDELAGSVSKASGLSMERISSTPDTDSIGNIYSRVTFMMGFVPWEHEYKIMGMAPYASEKQSEPLKKELLSYVDLSKSDPLVFERKIPEPTRLICRRLQNWFEYQRFDNIANALQGATEELVLRWVREAIAKTGIHKLALAGGVFMNVKLNKLIAELPEVTDVFVFPSCGDETNPVGASYLTYIELSGKDPSPIGPIYWGPGLDGVEQVLKEESANNGFQYEEVEDIDAAVADLLVENKIVARVSDSMEFGARALGNRSILADPRDLANVQVINRMIKMRDFWMPFAPVIIQERRDDYLCQSKPSRSPYMMFAFDIQQDKRQELIAAIHQADGTARPQIIERDYNPAYHSIVQRFEKSTGLGALLNTSFNLHGYPIALGAKEAMWVFKTSGLKYLALGNYLLHKN